MRQSGTLTAEDEARTFSDYLVTLGIRSRVEPSDDGWAVWIYDEADVPRSKQELEQFRADPQGERYSGVTRAAQQARRAEAKQDARTRKYFIDLRGRWDAQARRARPVTSLFILASIAITLVTHFGDPRAALTRELFIATSRAGLTEVLHGQVWRLVTPIFVHMAWFHLAFNVYWVYVLGGLVETRRGPLRYAALVLTIAVLSNLAQFWAAGPYFGGLSGVGYGLFGYVWLKGRFDPDSGMYIDPTTAFIWIAWFLLCLTGNLGPVANTAHGVGLLIGCAAAVMPLAWRRR